MARSTKEVFEHHRDAILALDIEEGLKDYTDDSVFITLDGTFKGVEGVRGFYNGMLENFPNITVTFVKVAIEGDTVLLQWSADSDVARFPMGVATFIIRDDKILVQTEWMVVEPK